MHRAHASWLLAIALLLMAPATSFAEPERSFGVNIGAFIPYNPEQTYGGEFRLEVLRRKESDSRLRTGMTLGVRGNEIFSSNIFVPLGDTGYLISSRIGLLAHWMIIPEGLLQPYIGAGGELFVNVTDPDLPARPPPDINRTNGGISLSFILGLDVKVSDNWKIFVEGRAAGDFAFGTDILRIRDISGFTGATGVRVRF
jgi:hypothetical protein